MNLSESDCNKSENFKAIGNNDKNGNEKKLSNIEKNNAEYEPYDHILHNKQSITYFDATFHFLKASFGTGSLAIPYAFYNAGYVVGIVGTLCTGFLSTCCMHNLVSAEYELCKRKKVPCMTYAELVQSAFEEGPIILRRFALYARLISDVFMTTFQFGVSCIYVVFISSNFKNVYDTYTGNGNSSENGIDIRLIMLYITLPLIFILWIPNLKLLVPFTSVANFISLLSFVIIFYYIFNDIPSVETIEPIAPISRIPLFFSTVMFSMEAIGMVLPLKNEMTEPKKFGSWFGVLNVSMVPLTILYVVIGLFGYLKYGEKTQASVTLNLPNDDLLANVVKLSYSLAIYMNYALYSYVVYEIVWMNYLKQRFKQSNRIILWNYVTRTSIAISAVIVAVAVPKLDLFISLIGALCLSTLGIGFPAIIYMLVQWEYRHDTSKYTITVIKQGFILIIAILAFITGVSTTIMAFIETI